MTALSSEPLAKKTALPFGVRPRGLCRNAAAAYVGVSPSLFDEMVKDGRVPKPKLVNTRLIWDVVAMDEAFDDLPTKGADNPWDQLYG